MTDLPDDLTQLWKRQDEKMTTAELSLANPKKLTSSLESWHRKERARLIFLNVREVIPALVVAGFFVWLGVDASEAKWTYFLAAVIVLGVAVKLMWETMQERRVEKLYDDTIKGQLERTVFKISNRVRILRTVIWWYILPLSAAVALLYFGAVQVAGEGPKSSDLFLPVGVFAIGVFTYWLNNFAAKKYEAQLPPYQALLDELK